MKQSHHYLNIANQNTNALLQLLYTTKAVHSAKVARKLAPEQEVNTIVGEDVSEWIDDLLKMEGKRLTYMGHRYPDLQVGSGILIWVAAKYMFDRVQENQETVIISMFG